MASEGLTRENQFTASNKFNPVGPVPTVFYIPEYVSADEEEQLLNNIYQAPVSKWKSLKNRRLQNWGGVVHEKGLLAQDLPIWLKQITHRICEESKLFPSSINHVLINEYLPDQGIMSHQDGPAYEPVVAILSLGSPVVMDFVPHPSFINSCPETPENHIIDINKKSADIGISSGVRLSEYLPFSVALMPRSLLIFKDKAYSEYLHGIEDCEKHQYDEAVNLADCLKYVQAQSASGPNIATDDCDTEPPRSTIFHRTFNRKLIDTNKSIRSRGRKSSLIENGTGRTTNYRMNDLGSWQDTSSEAGVQANLG